MEIIYCNRCGARLILTNLGYNYCSNCGKLPENQTWDKEQAEKDAEVRYVG